MNHVRHGNADIGGMKYHEERESPDLLVMPGERLGV